MGERPARSGGGSGSGDAADARDDAVRRRGRSRWSGSARCVAVVVLCAVVMGLPTLRGAFGGGDDRQLVVNHVLVNRPSLKHAVKLFTIFHRDLYQPLPLLSFSMEFAIASRFGLFDEGLEGGAWLMHATNVMLHAMNAALVWAVVFMLQRRRDVATVAAVLFAVHPLQVETVAWVNGRMMLLSTAFALASLVCFGGWLRAPRRRLAVCTAVCVALAMMSKVRIGLPVTMVLIPLAWWGRRGWIGGIVPGSSATGDEVRTTGAERAGVAVGRGPSGPAWSRRRCWGLWCVCVVITAVFVVINYKATAATHAFEAGAAFLKGSRIARSFQTLGWYFEHFVWPVGLAPWYPTPEVVHWTDAASLRGVAVVVGVCALIVWFSRRSVVGVLGLVWFFATIASTLPLVPARNLLAADRYMYFPMVGLLWIVAAGACAARQRVGTAWSSARRRAVTAAASLAVVVGAMLASWHVETFYRTAISRPQRVAELYPSAPTVWNRLGWAYHAAGRRDRSYFAKALRCGRRELEENSDTTACGAYQLIAMAQLSLGHREAALAALRRAIDADPSDAVAKYRLAAVLEDAGDTEHALSLYEAALSLDPYHNPTLGRLSSLYHRLGRETDARAMFEKALANNPYDVHALVGLAQLDMESGTAAGYASAVTRLRGLLAWMPEHTDARTNLGAALAKLGRADEAMGAYEEVLARDPSHAPALLNLALLLSDPRHAAEAVGVWARYVAVAPASAEGRAMLAWTRALSGDTARAAVAARRLLGDAGVAEMATATLVLTSLAAGDYDAAMVRAGALGAAGAGGADARARLVAALEAYGEARPEAAWTYCVVARLLIGEGRVDAARAAVELCAERCVDDACRAAVMGLRAGTAAPSP
ncbi:MAG: tetratricopeptide repeat protein [Phycisphaerae bacterium]